MKYSRFSPVFLVIFFSFILVLPVYSGDRNEGTASGVFLKIGAGARPAAMGGAGSAFARDVSAVYWNPAGLAYTPERAFTFMHAELLADQSLEYLAYAHPGVFGGSLGFGLTYVNEGKFDRLTIDQNGFAQGNQGTFRASDISGVVSYGRVINPLIAFGVNLKFIHQSIDSSNGSAFAADLGLQFKTPLENLTGSFVVQDIGTQIKLDRQGFSLPLQIKGGLAYRAWDGKAALVLDATKPSDNDLGVGVGGEYWVIPNFAIRAGWNSSNEIDNGITVGAGFRYKRFDIDYAFVPYQELGDMHRISGVVRFGSSEVTRYHAEKIHQRISALKPRRKPRYRARKIQPVATLKSHLEVDIEALYMNALDDFNGEDYEGARKIILDIFSVNPEYVPALVLMGQLDITTGDNSAAIRRFRHVLALDPSNSTARTLLNLLK